MNILFVYAEDYPWDIRVQKITRALHRHGHAITLVARNLERRPSRERVDVVECLRVTAPGLAGPLNTLASMPAFFSPVWRRRIHEGIASHGADLVIVRDLPLAPLAIAEAHRHGIPAIVDMAENHPAMWEDVADDSRFRPASLLLKNPGLARRMERWVARHADAILVVVEEMRDHIVSLGASADRVSIVSNTPDLGQFDDTGSGIDFDWLPPGDTIDIVYVGFINLFRGLQHVIHAMEVLGERAHPFRLVAAGDGEDVPELKRMAAAAGQQDRAIFAGWLAHEQVPALIHRSHIGVIPHRRTGHTDATVPNKVFDYMACKKPVLVSDAKPLARIATEMECGLVFRSGDPHELAAQIDRLRDPALRARMGAAGRKAVEDRFNWAHDVDILLESVAKLGRRRPF